MNISIIIPTYNRSQYIGLTIESFLNQKYDSGYFELIICDNNSTDNTSNVISRYVRENSRVKYLFEDRQGVHYARNSAAKISNFEILYYTDDDMIADENLLSEISKVFDFDNSVAVATGRVLPLWETEPPKWITKHCNNYLLSLYDPPLDFQVSREPGFLYSCHQAIRRDVFFRSEGFNPENTKGVWVGDGETGLNEKIKKLGFKFGFNGRSVIKHMIPKERMTQSYLNKRIGNNGYCHSYSDFQRNEPAPGKLLVKLLLRTFIKGPLHVLNFMVKAIIEKDLDYLRFSLAYVFYYYRRFRYDLKLVFNPKWRLFVLKKDWLSNDSL